MVEGRAPRRTVRYTASGRAREEASVPEEAPVGVRLNGKPVAVLHASPVAPDELALGHLALLGRVRAAEDVRRVAVRRAPLGVRVDVEARPRGLLALAARPPLPLGPRLAPAQVHARMRDLLDGAAMYREGGGVHTSALAGPDALRLLAADVGKVNTIDRLAGQALLQRVETRGAVLLTTGRLTGAMVERGVTLGCSVLVSHSGPTTAGLDATEQAGATLVGYVRGGSFSVYADPGRVGRPARRAG